MRSAGHQLWNQVSVVEPVIFNVFIFTAFQYKTGPYISVLWVGLNTKCFLQTHMFLPESVPEDCCIVDLFKCNFTTNYRESYVPLSDTLTTRVLQSANQCAHNRFLLVVDCYQGAHNVELMLNRAIQT